MKQPFDLHDYSDIIDLPHKISPNRRRMTNVERGAQFSPFAALTGYEDAIRETGRLTDSRIELDEGGKELVNEQIKLVLEHACESPCVTVTWFQPDQWKEGGAYITLTGNVRRVDEYRRRIELSDGHEIPIEEICHLVCHQSGLT